MFAARTRGLTAFDARRCDLVRGKFPLQRIERRRRLMLLNDGVRFRVGLGRHGLLWSAGRVGGRRIYGRRRTSCIATLLQKLLGVEQGPRCLLYTSDAADEEDS